MALRLTAWNRIASPRVPGMTLEQAPQREPWATQWAVQDDGFAGITRASRIEAAVLSDPGTQQIAIYIDQGHHQDDGGTSQGGACGRL